MDLDLDLDLRTGPGRAAVPLEAEKVRDLEHSDLMLLNEDKGIKAPALARLSQRHHSLAKALALGTMTQAEAAVVCGYTPARVGLLLASPAFKDLVAHYRNMANEVYVNAAQRLADLSLEAIDEMRRRLEEEPENVSSRDVLKAIELAADRTGYGPTSKSEVQVNVNLASRLESARRRVEDARKDTILDLEAN